MALPTASLDFDEIKNNLIEFLRTKPEFTDYNFEGSALNTLLDLLAYNTHYLGMYSNALVQESFLDSAQARSSVVSRAKELGYTPRSATSAEAIVNIILRNVPVGTPAFSLQRNTVTFSASNGDRQLTFNVTESQRVKIDGATYTFEDVRIKEGVFVQNRYRVTVGDTGNATKSFVIPNKNVDTSTLKVFVFPDDISNSSEEYTKANNTIEFDSTSRVYFLQENFNGLYEVYFGDDVIGKALENGNVVLLEYVTTSLEEGNGCSNFVMNGLINGYSALAVVTKQISSGGKDKESIEDIKFYAPKAFTQQNRAVTTTDYESYIREILPNVDSIAVWGGEDNIPPVYGKVFIALKAAPGVTFADSVKETLLNTLVRQRAVVTVLPEFKDPDEFYLTINSTIKQNRQRASLDETALRDKVFNQTQLYFNQFVERFNINLYYSNLVKFIDGVDPSIVSNLTDFILSKRFVPVLNEQKAYFTEFENPILRNSVESVLFTTRVNNITYNVKIRDNPDIVITKENFLTGNIEQYSQLEIYNADSEQKEFIAKVGEINYDRGIIDFAVNVNALPSLQTSLIVYATPQSFDLTTFRNKIILLDDNVANTVSGQKLGINIQVLAQ